MSVTGMPSRSRTRETVPNAGGSAISNTDVIPVIASDLFAGDTPDEFAAGMIGKGTASLPGRSREFNGYLRLRASVYLRQMHMLPPDAESPDGTERDEEDARSLHFGVFARAGDGARVVASMRLIHKSEAPDQPLPVEQLFPEAFAEGPAPASSIEISRLISRHEDGETQYLLKWPMVAAALSYAASQGFPPTYALVRPSLAAKLTACGVDVRQISQPRLIPEFGEEYVAIAIDAEALARRMGQAHTGSQGDEPGTDDEFTYFDLAGSLAAAA